MTVLDPFAFEILESEISITQIERLLEMTFLTFLHPKESFFIYCASFYCLFWLHFDSFSMAILDEEIGRIIYLIWFIDFRGAGGV